MFELDMRGDNLTSAAMAPGPAPGLAPELAPALARSGWPSPLARPRRDRELPEALLAPLLQAAATTPAAEPPSLLRRRLLARVARSAATSRALHTVRQADLRTTSPAPGVTLRTLYRADGAGGPNRSARPGEPSSAVLVELAPGTRWEGPPDSAHQREWLVLGGALSMGSTMLAAHDYQVAPPGTPATPWQTDCGALLYQREARATEAAPAAPVTARAASACWDDYAPGIRRRLLWRQGGEAAMLYHALPGASVPHHGHRHDEECLMLAGDFFLDEVLLRPLDYQLAPAGTEHRTSATDTGLIVFAHGDFELALA